MSKITSSRLIKLLLNPITWALITFFLGLLLQKHPTLTEAIYSQTFYPWVSRVLSFVSFKVDASLSDSLYIALPSIFLVFTLLLFFKQVSFKRYFINLIKTVSFVYASFYFLWGFNYYRQPIYNRIDLTKHQPNTEELLNVFEFVIEQTNQSYCSFSNFNEEKSDSAIENSFKKLSSFLKIHYRDNQRKVKYITFSNFFAKATILGYYGPFFNEVHINAHLSPWDIPIVTAHEKSHQFGIASEAEANLYGLMSCISCTDKYARYSAWLFALDHFIYNTKSLPQRKILVKKIAPNVVNDIIAHHKYWQQLRDETIDNVTTKVNDTYLKTNNVSKGIDDYNDVVQLIIDIYYSDKNLLFFDTNIKN